jgi:hypothetical protein
MLSRFAAIAAVLLAQVAIAWAVAGVLGVLAARWRVHWRSGSGWMAVLLWMAPLALIPLLSSTPVPAVGIAVVGASAALFGLTATRLRRQYRITSEARRLVLRFGSLLVPILVAYPLASALAERTTRTVIERDYGPATVAARQLDALMRTLERAQAEIDRVPNLERLARPGADAEASSQAAFIAWNQTVLSKDRVTSEIELYDAERRLTSRFALNVPEFTSLYQMGEQTWQGRGCQWAAFSEVQRFGADERSMLHAERGICADGVFQGAVVVHIVPDYRALPFVSSANPYYDVLSLDVQQRRSRIADLQLVVYGWSLQPIFTSGRASWPIDKEIDASLSQSRQPFWRDREALRPRVSRLLSQRPCRRIRAGLPVAHAAATRDASGRGRDSTRRPLRRLPRGRHGPGAVHAQQVHRLPAAVPRNQGQLLSQALSVLCAGGRRPGAVVRHRVRRVHDRQAPRRRGIRSWQRGGGGAPGV